MSLPPTRSVQLVLRNGWKTRKFNVGVVDDDTIANVKSKLSMKCGLDAGLMKIIFCGRKLDENTSIQSLMLSPQTNLIVTVKPHQHMEYLQQSNNEVGAQSSKSSSFTIIHSYSSFYVFCKKCEMLKRGKLRAYCTECHSLSIVFSQEPTGWIDVIGYKKLKVDCKECERTQTASVHFKCVDCGEDSIPLTQVRRNVCGSEKSDEQTCEVCDDSDFSCHLTFVDCTHICCVDCFKAYCAQMHAQQNFVMKPTTGFTVTCPVYRCSGIDAYKRFQHQTTEMFIIQQNERQYCPSPECGAAFFLDSENESLEDEKMILCPECLKLFCRYCRVMSDCKCNEKLEDASLQTIRQTSKKCPKCDTSTERNGGCAHIHCTQCQHQWCFTCGCEWSDECQWDHWFD